MCIKLPICYDFSCVEMNIQRTKTEVQWKKENNSSVNAVHP